MERKHWQFGNIQLDGFCMLVQLIAWLYSYDSINKHIMDFIIVENYIFLKQFLALRYLHMAQKVTKICKIATFEGEYVF